MTARLAYNVKTIRAAGIECKWGRISRGRPAIFGKAHNGQWVVIDGSMWNEAERTGDLKLAFENATAFIDLFSIDLGNVFSVRRA